MIVLETNRLQLAHLAARDAGFMLELLNTPNWLRFIGDRGVKSLSDAEAYIAECVTSYDQHGFGMYRVALREQEIPVGICGLLKRETLEDVDIGFAFLPEWEGRGLGYESARAMLDMARDDLSIRRVVAITTPANERSILLLKKIGMMEESNISVDGEPLLLFAVDFE